VTAVRRRANPLAAGILLGLFGLGLAIIVPFIGLTLGGIGLILVLWGGVISWSRK
jgi:tetrahydromethanopterin S-methyltransferase subunit C